ncbi:phosphate/phosphite/phosphonate ABC transporter substrate-binding protein [Desulfovibrio sp. JC022]|uniref:phosphate/phosphite/phosphonate ABC transporter substrate-binding protein n=1 Tax=Desulfovibrio sp. JC022 TaxID=2593642 RepID=UPI0013D828B7|nr:PhnD/SsuA/transferrin family substrate-binding protein [Desulfovibrio sp. JC022]NDV22525.1 phosphate/phosphite/phosphonate ABC transporter substrate-binding protein [Desulfovibrio sp. JC022]
MFRRVIVFAFVLVLTLSSVAFAGRFDFAILQPGQPGTTAEAQPVMDELAKYLSAKLGENVKGVYYNDLNAALDYLGKNKPTWAISGLTFYKSYVDKFAMVPVASTLPQGMEKDVWRLIVPASGPDSPEKVQGTVYGSMLYTPQSLGILFSGNKSGEFTVEGTHKALRMLRKVNKGKVSGVVLDAVQYSVIKDSSRYSNTKVIYTSPKLPNSPVVWFGNTSDDAFRLQAVLLDMDKDPAANDLLKLLQTAGFNPADKDLR